MMKPSFSQLFEINELQSLCEIFSNLTGFATAILDMEGNVLTATGWQEICSEFHRKNPETAEKCRESDTALWEMPTPGAKYNVYSCRNGLIDVSVPIMIENEQVGRLYTGQFLFAPPDIDYFRCQAAEFGFDETSYLEAVQKVSIVSEEQVGQVMEFLCRLAEMIGRMGLGNQRLREANAELRESRQELERHVDERTAELSAKNEQLRMEVDERKRAEEELQRTNNLLHAIIEAAPAAIIGLDLDGNVHRVWNPTAERMLGWNAGEVMGRPLPTVPLDKKEEFSRFRELIRSGKSLNGVEVHRQKHDGTPIDYSIYASPLRDAGGRVTGNIAVLVDISERKQAEEALRRSEEKYRAVADFTYDWETWLGPDGRFIYVSPSCERISGYAAEEFIDDPSLITKIVHPDDRETVEKHQEKVLAGDFPFHELDYRIINRNGGECWIEHCCQSVYGKDGKWLGQRASNRDITERKLAEVRINAALAEKEILLKEVHHRVKNNLQIITTLLDLQFESIDDERSIRALRESQERIKAMALVHEKIYQSTDLASIDFADYVEKLARFLFNSYMVDQERITLNFDVGQLPLEIDRAIPCGLIINELVSNALKHAFPGGRKGEITIHLHCGDDGRIWLTVADNGTGLAPGVDFRNTETLGLQLVNMLTRQLAGNIELKNENGATFTISFMGTAGRNPV